MKITRVAAYQVDLPLHEGSYKWSGGKSVEVFDSTIVEIETDDGMVGYGEVCPLGPFYLPAYADGVRAGIKELAPHLLGCDPTHLDVLNRRMDAALKGHPYVKSGIDMACWDILGQLTGQPVCHLLGGRYGNDFVLYRAISQESPDEMASKVAGYRDEGYRRFQLKVGADPQLDIERIRMIADLLDEVIAAGLQGAQLGREHGRRWFGCSVAFKIEQALDIAGDGQDTPTRLRRLFDEVGATLNVPETVGAAFGILRMAEGDPKQTAILAANLSGDADTIGAIACAIAGAHAGMDAIPAADVAVLEADAVFQSYGVREIAAGLQRMIAD